MRPDSPPQLLFRYAWLVLIVVTCANAAFWWRAGAEARRKDPSLTESYKKLIGGFLFWANLPWAYVGFAILSGGVSSLHAILDPREGGAWSLSWYGLVAVIYFLGSKWILFDGGAEAMIRHPGLLRGPQSAFQVKLVWLLGVAGGLFAMIFAWFHDFGGSVMRSVPNG